MVLPAAQAMFTVPPTIGAPTAAVPLNVLAAGALPEPPPEPPQAVRTNVAVVVRASNIILFTEDSFMRVKND